MRIHRPSPASRYHRAALATFARMRGMNARQKKAHASFERPIYCSQAIHHKPKNLQWWSSHRRHKSYHACIHCSSSNPLWQGGQKNVMGGLFILPVSRPFLGGRKRHKKRERMRASVSVLVSKKRPGTYGPKVIWQSRVIKDPIRKGKTLWGWCQCCQPCRKENGKESWRGGSWERLFSVDGINGTSWCQKPRRLPRLAPGSAVPWKRIICQDSP
jgi:hypothetical protein